MCCHLGRAIAVAILLVANAAAAERTWTNVKGQKMQAEFVRETGGEVTFLKGGMLVTVRLADLSEADRKVVQDLAAGKPVVEEPAPSSDAPPTIAPPPAEPAASRPAAKKPLPIVSRVWTNKAGVQTTAKFVRVFDGKVVLARSNGRPLTIAFYDLVAEDQEHLRELLASRGQEALIPAPPPAATPENPPSAVPGVPLPGPPPGFEPPSFSPPSIPPPPVPGSGSSLMEEMRQRHEQQRQEMLQRIEQQRLEQAQRIAEARQKFDDDQERRRQEAEERRQNEFVGECLSCKGKLTRAQAEQETCPHCSVKWNFEVDAFGHKRPIFKPTASASTATPPRANAPAASPRKVDPAVVARISRFIVIGVVAVGLLVVMAIVVIVGIAILASSGSKPKQKFY